MVCEKQPLFIAGCPRSGTTVLTRLLNLHPDIVVGEERYKTLYGSSRQITREMFQEEMFFNFQAGETNYIPSKSAGAAQFYGRAKTKFPNARFVGDKYPQFFRFYGKIFREFPEAKIVFIVRDPLSVAQSWQRRADDSTSWPAKNDARRSVTYWNDSLAYTLAYAQANKEAFVFVQYEELFRTKLPVLVNVFRGIGANLSPAILEQLTRDAQTYFEESEKITGRKVELDNSVIEAIRGEAAESLHAEIIRLAREQSVVS